MPAPPTVPEFYAIGRPWSAPGHRSSAGRELRLPAAGVDIVCVPGRAPVVVGPMSLAAIIRVDGNGVDVCGVTLAHGWAATALGVAVHELLDQVIELSQLPLHRSVELGSRFADAADPGDLHAALGVLERTLATRVSRRPERRAAITRATEWLARGDVGVAPAAAALSLSVRRLEQLFREEVGLSPKTFQRLQRFRRATDALDLAHPRPSAQALGYFDDSHMIRDFRAFSGLTPVQYMALRRVEPAHLAID